jgi:hypothetical protein
VMVDAASDTARPEDPLVLKPMEAPPAADASAAPREPGA